MSKSDDNTEQASWDDLLSRIDRVEEWASEASDNLYVVTENLTSLIISLDIIRARFVSLSEKGCR
ncbi:hypothetical protein [Xylella fastidiosa]|uniref:hypothetical protein n=1 Tax=Xylella fastidiosa TaxID=2371 RepID=UPI000A51D438|nr:hypothetical protein [Xylella fastidiosa]